mmetsp:Transcript_1635/g.4742  ORF Transcript_1635/g.4742 Transcript_1635/m.4742 type:complete len:277 (+) Transcript_1635:820-1650(+)
MGVVGQAAVVEQAEAGVLEVAGRRHQRRGMCSTLVGLRERPGADHGTPIDVAFQGLAHLVEDHHGPHVRGQGTFAATTHAHHLHPRAVEGCDGIHLRVVHLEARQDFLGGVVVTLDDARRHIWGRRVVRHMVNLAVHGVYPAAGDALHDDIVSDLQMQNNRYLDTSRLQSLGLGPGPREAIQKHTSVRAVSLGQSLLQHRGHQIVRHQPARAHARRNLGQELGALPEQVTGRDVHHAVALRQEICLCLLRAGPTTRCSWAGHPVPKRWRRRAPPWR